MCTYVGNDQKILFFILTKANSPSRFAILSPDLVIALHCTALFLDLYDRSQQVSHSNTNDIFTNLNIFTIFPTFLYFEKIPELSCTAELFLQKTFAQLRRQEFQQSQLRKASILKDAGR